MKKGIFFLIALFIMGGAVGAFAETADTTHKGSLLIFPNIKAAGAGKTETFISIGNDGPADPVTANGDVTLECYWVDGVTQNFVDFQITLTPHQPFAFSSDTSTYNSMISAPSDPFTSGFLVCYAVAPDGRGLSWNYLYGNAFVVDYVNNTSYAYPAWSFRALTVPAGTELPVTLVDDVSLKIPLDGVAYSSCPTYLSFNFPLEGQSGITPVYAGINELTVLPCTQDLRESHSPTYTKLEFVVYNVLEENFSNVYACSACWWDKFLTDSSIYNNAAFTAGWNPNPTFPTASFLDVARFDVYAISDPVCSGSTAQGIIGQLVSFWPFNKTLEAFEVSGWTPSQGDPGCILVDSPQKASSGAKLRK